MCGGGAEGSAEVRHCVASMVDIGYANERSPFSSRLSACNGKVYGDPFVEGDETLNQE